MSRPFNRTAILPLWIVFFGLFALFVSPMTVATGVLLLTVGIVAPAVMLILWQVRTAPRVEVPGHVEREGHS